MATLKWMQWHQKVPPITLFFFLSSVGKHRIFLSLKWNRFHYFWFTLNPTFLFLQLPIFIAHHHIVVAIKKNWISIRLFEFMHVNLKNIFILFIFLNFVFYRFFIGGTSFSSQKKIHWHGIAITFCLRSIEAFFLSGLNTRVTRKIN